MYFRLCSERFFSQLTDKMHKERDRVSDIIRQEFADRLVFTDEENKRIKTEISELKARQRIELDKAKEEIEEIKRQKDDEMEEVHKRSVIVCSVLTGGMP